MEVFSTFFSLHTRGTYHIRRGRRRRGMGVNCMPWARCGRGVGNAGVGCACMPWAGGGRAVGAGWAWGT